MPPLKYNPLNRVFGHVPLFSQLSKDYLIALTLTPKQVKILVSDVSIALIPT